MLVERVGEGYKKQATAVMRAIADRLSDSPDQFLKSIGNHSESRTVEYCRCDESVNSLLISFAILNNRGVEVVFSRGKEPSNSGHSLTLAKPALRFDNGWQLVSLRESVIQIPIANIEQVTIITSTLAPRLAF